MSFKYEWLDVAEIQTSIIVFPMIALLYIGFIINIYQYKYGSRFFLPNWCRTKRFEYRREIANDFELIKHDENMWPEWDIWMQKLNLPSLHSNNRSLSKIEGNRCYAIYMKTHTRMKLHYFWLEWFLKQSVYLRIPLYKIDEFED